MHQLGESTNVPASIENQKAGIDRIKLYWAKRCACESGNTVSPDALNEAVRITNLNYDLYHQGKNKGDYKASNYPVPDRKISISDCKKASSQSVNTPDYSNCNNIQIVKADDPQQFGNAFLISYCACEKGVNSESQAKELAASMKVNYDNCVKHYGSNIGLPQPLSWEKCVGKNSSNQKNNQLIYTGNESNLQKAKDEYIKTFNPQSFNAYASGENIKRQGLALAFNLSNQVSSIGSLANTFDPDALLADFNQKIQQIETIEAEYKAANNSYSFNSGKDLGNSISSGNYESAMYQLGGILNANAEQKEAERKLQEQKQALYKQRLNQMSKIYWKAVDYNTNTKDKFIKAAAYTEKETDEKYNLGMAENLDCFGKNMKSKFSTSNTFWLVNNCPKPTKQNITTIENKFVEKDVQYSQIAERKFNYFKESKLDEFRDAAIAYVSSAIKLNPQAKYFIQLAYYYQNYSAILELSNILTAEAYSPNCLNKLQNEHKASLLEAVEHEVRVAIVSNNQAYLNTFLNVGFDQIIFVNKQDVLSFAIALDQPDAVQLILNKRIEKANKEISQKEIKKTIMLCAINNSFKTIKRFVELGVDINFKLSNQTPLEVAEKSLSDDAFLIFGNSQKISALDEKSPIMIVVGARTDPKKSALNLDQISGSPEFYKIIEKMIDEIDEKEYFKKVLGNSISAKNYIQNNSVVNNEIKNKLYNELNKPTYLSKSHLFFEEDLIEFDKVPNMGEFILENSKVIKYSKPLSKEEELELFIKMNAGLSKETKDKYFPFIDSPQNITMEDERLIESQIFIVLSDGYYAQKYPIELKEAYHKYYSYKYSAFKVIPLSTKIEHTLEALNNNLKKYGDSPQKHTSKLIERINEYSNKPNLTAVEEASIHRTYASNALQYGFPLDQISIDQLIGKPILYTNRNVSRSFNENLAYKAFMDGNYKLFKILDKKYNLNEVICPNGEPLMLEILKTGSMLPKINKFGLIGKELESYEDMMKNKLVFYSKDFNFNEKQKNIYPLQQYLSHIDFTSILSFPQESIKELIFILEYYNVNINQVITSDGGTIAHWFVEQLVKNTLRESKDIESLGDFLKSNQYDKTIKNNQNLTAFQLFEKEGKNVRKYYFSSQSNKNVKTKQYISSILK